MSLQLQVSSNDDFSNSANKIPAAIVAANNLPIGLPKNWSFRIIDDVDGHISYTHTNNSNHTEVYTLVINDDNQITPVLGDISQYPGYTE